MKVLLSWLKEFVPELDDSPESIGDRLSALGLAVESTEVLGEGIDSIVVARVLDLRPHPDADRIQLVDVDAGDGEALQVCCGAFNMSVGDLIPFAPIGTTMPNGIEIARRKMRGEMSNGMCCSAVEIGMGDDSDGIMILSDALDESTVGTPLTEALGLERDVLWDLEVNANRPDCMSVLGVARDLAGSIGIALELPSFEYPATGGDASEAVSVSIDDPGLCGRFVVRVLTDVELGSSPQWIQQRLIALGMRPINRIVDISNYVMLELGQPNHTYDLDLLPGGALATRRARAGETLVTLDGADRVLVETDGVIVDRDDKVIGLAGVMGGQSTEISDATTNVALEMAWWDPPSISRTVKRLNLPSEASTRFRRGADWGDTVELALDRFCQLATADGGARVAGGTVDVGGQTPDRAPVVLRAARLNGLLGTELTAEEIGGHLTSIGFDVSNRDDANLDVTIPTWRWDCEAEVDLVEEVARLHGYEKLDRTVPKGEGAGGLSDLQTNRRAVRQVLVGLGIDEAQPMPFLAPGDLSAAGLDENGVTLTNPLVAEESVLRTSLLPGLLKAIAYNQSHRTDDARLFEIGHVFLPSPEGQLLPDEREYLAVALADEQAPAAVRVVATLADALALPNLDLRNGPRAGLHPTRTAEVFIAGKARGEVGQVDPAVADAFGVAGPVAWVQLDLGALLEGPHGKRTYRRVSKFPSSDVDLAFEVQDDVPASRVAGAVRAGGGALLVESELFDVHRGAGVSEGGRGLAFRLRFQADDRTLTDDEVGAARQACIDKVEAIEGVTLRQ